VLVVLLGRRQLEGTAFEERSAHLACELLDVRLQEDETARGQA
jgi:hypothetical protein